MGIARQTFGIAPGVGRVRSAGGFGGVFEHGFDVIGLVEGEVDRLAHFWLVQRWVLAVEGDERGHEGVSLFDFQGRFFQRGLYVQWFGRQGDLALIAAQLLQTHVGVRGDGEDQRIDLGLASEVIGIGLVADRRVFLESCEDERAGADWLVVELFRRAALE
ncbi:hypothetical protein D3C72_1277390 [compost metagenome]